MDQNNSEGNQKFKKKNLDFIIILHPQNIKTII